MWSRYVCVLACVFVCERDGVYVSFMTALLLPELGWDLFCRSLVSHLKQHRSREVLIGKQSHLHFLTCGNRLKWWLAVTPWRGAWEKSPCLFALTLVSSQTLSRGTFIRNYVSACQHLRYGILFHSYFSQITLDINDINPVHDGTAFSDNLGDETLQRLEVLAGHLIAELTVIQPFFILSVQMPTVLFSDIVKTENVTLRFCC